MATTLRQIGRLFRIGFVLVKHGLDEIASAIHLFWPTRWLAKLIFSGREPSKQALGERLRLALEELGPVFVKFGQMLSTRSDLLPEEIASELAKLQDQVKPFPPAVAQKLIEKTLGAPVSSFFDEFERVPLASASVAQVHAAKLKDGQDVVVKILRPNVQKQIEADLALLKTLATSAQNTWKPIRRFKPKEIVKEFEKSILGELNLQREAANTAQLRRNFEGSPLLYVPKVYWPFVRKNLLVMERIYGISIAEPAVLKAHGINLKQLAERGVEIFFTQVFRDSFFHADMHPGNIFVSPNHPESPQYIAVDCGIVGTLSAIDQRYVAENFLAFWRRDYGKIARLHVESGWVAGSTRLDEFESVIRTICEPIFGLPLKEISFAKFLMHLFQAAREFDIQIQPQLVLLQKTLFYIEGVGRKLYPDLDPWQIAGPFLEEWARTKMNPKAFWKKIKDSAELLLHTLEQGELPRILQATPAYRLEKTTTEKASKRLVMAIFSSTLLFGAFLLANLHASWQQISLISWMLAGSGFILSLLAWFW